MNLEEVASFFTQHDDFILTSHESPDADGLGAQYALLLSLEAMGKRVRAVNADDYSAKYAFIDARERIEALGRTDLLDRDLSACTVVLLDTNDIQYTGEMADIALARAARILVFDHHEAKGVTRDEACSLPDMSSTSEMAYWTIRRMGVAIEPDVATALLAGIVYDTGSFAYAKTSAGTFEAALDLVKLGASPSGVHGALYESSETSALLLRKEVLSTLELHMNNGLAFQTMGKDILERTGANYEEAEDLINVPLQSKTVEVSAFFKENLQGTLRCSLRSKGAVNVAHIAQSFGGGGHRTAAGFKSPYPLETIKKKVLELLSSAMPD